MSRVPPRSIRIGDVDISYVVHGDGSPLLLLHGFSGAGCNWEPFAGAFVPEYRLIIPDLRGHGGSTNPSGQFTFRQCARDIAALLDHLGVERCNAIGVSGGGNTLLHLATQQPERLEAMVLVSATPYFPAQARGIMNDMTIESLSAGEWAVMRQWHKHGDEQIRALWRQAHEFKDSYDDMCFTPPLLSTIRARTLIIHGDRDPLYPVSMATELFAAIPGAHLWIIPRGGHTPVFGEHMPAFVATATTFLRP